MLYNSSNRFVSKITMSIIVTVTAFTWSIARGQEATLDPSPHNEPPPGIEVIDAQAFSPTTTPGLAQNPTQAVDSSWSRVGVYADGTSVLLIRLKPVNWSGSSVTFSIKHDRDPQVYPQTPDFIGSLSLTFPTLPAPNSTAGNTSISVDGQSPKVIYYTPPISFLFGPKDQGPAITIKACRGDTGEVLGSIVVDLLRPPIVLTLQRI